MFMNTILCIIITAAITLLFASLGNALVRIIKLEKDYQTLALAHNCMLNQLSEVVKITVKLQNENKNFYDNSTVQ